MANAKIKIREEKVMVEQIQKKECVVLELSMEEAEILKCFVGTVCGKGKGKDLTDSIYYALANANIVSGFFDKYFCIKGDTILANGS